VVNGSLRGVKEQRSFKPQAAGSIPAGRTISTRAQRGPLDAVNAGQAQPAHTYQPLDMPLRGEIRARFKRSVDAYDTRRSEVDILRKT
jgi:hypothetical protein